MKAKIRKALEGPVFDLAQSLSITVQLNKQSIDSSPLPQYLTTHTIFGRDDSNEVGRDRRIQRPGRFRIGIFTQPSDGEDKNDEIASQVRGVYDELDDDLVHDGIRVSILSVDDGECVPIGSHLYAPVYVNFMVWEANNV